MVAQKQVTVCLKPAGAVLMSMLISLSLAGCGSPQHKECEPEITTVHTYQIDGLTVRTGDLICTNVTEQESIFEGLFFVLFGTLIPGEVDHIAVYVGPGGLCVEAGAKYRVATFHVKNNTWDASKMVEERGPLLDNLYGVAYPLAGLSLSSEEDAEIRKRVAQYCLNQAGAKKPYNIIFPDSSTENAFYCSQLAYKAYLREGIDLNTGEGLTYFQGSGSIIFPQEIWSGCEHKKFSGRRTN